MAVRQFYQLCYQGDLDGLKKCASYLTENQLEDLLSIRKGQFNFTLIHAAATNGKANILEYFLSGQWAHRRGGHFHFHHQWWVEKTSEGF